MRDILSQPAIQTGLRNPARELAALLAPNPCRTSASPTLFWSQALRSPSPFCAAFQLIQGIHTQFRDHSRTLLRHRIYLSHAPGPLTQGMLKIAAKRWALLDLTLLLSSPAMEAAPSAPLPALELGPTPLSLSPHQGILEQRATSGLPSLLAPLEGLRLLLELQALIPWNSALPRYARDRPIVALLVSAAGNVLAFETNHQEHSRLEHAELRLARRWWQTHQAPFPPGAKLFVTLEPCRMCAGALVESAATNPPPGEPALEIYFHERETGPSARHTFYRGRSVHVAQLQLSSTKAH